MARDTKEVITSIEQMTANQARNPEAARNALAFLFPKLADNMRVYLGSAREDAHERKRRFRISSKEYAPSYFGLQPSVILWSKSELDGVFDTHNPYQALSVVEGKIASAPQVDQSRLRREFFEQLSSAFRSSAAKFSQDWLDAIVRLSPIYIKAVDETAALMFSLDSITRLEFLIMDGLAQLNLAERVDVFETAINRAADISLLGATFRAIAGDVHEDGSRRENVSSADFGEYTDHLRNVLLERLHRIVDIGEFWTQAAPWELIWFWWGAGKQEEVKRFNDLELRKPVGLRALLEITVHLVRSTAGNYEVVSREVDKVVDVSELTRRAKELTVQTDVPTDRALAQRFLNALQNRSRRGF